MPNANEEDVAHISRNDNVIRRFEFNKLQFVTGNMLRDITISFVVAVAKLGVQSRKSIGRRRGTNGED